MRRVLEVADFVICKECGQLRAWGGYVFPVFRMA
jgi:hypothetical protein